MTDAWRVLSRQKVAIVAVAGHAIADGGAATVVVYMSPAGPEEPFGNVEAQDIAAVGRVI